MDMSKIVMALMGIVCIAFASLFMATMPALAGF
jgi:hypothetical protein